MDGRKCINENVVMYFDQEQESLRDEGDGVGRRRSFVYDASSRVVDQMEFTEEGDEAVDQQSGRMGAQGGPVMADLT